MMQMDLFTKKKKKTELEKEIENTYEIYEDSDIPIREKLVKQKKIRVQK